jgi:hypothetical protein
MPAMPNASNAAASVLPMDFMRLSCSRPRNRFAFRMRIVPRGAGAGLDVDQARGDWREGATLRTDRRSVRAGGFRFPLRH